MTSPSLGVGELVFRQNQQLAPQIEHRASVFVDRMTPLEAQYAQLAATGRIGGDWWKYLNSKNYPPNISRPRKVVLGECHFGVRFDSGAEALQAITAEPRIVRSADPYELRAWLQHRPQAGRERSLTTLDQMWQSPDIDQQFLPIVYDDEGVCRVGGDWESVPWTEEWCFLVVLETV